VNVLVAPPSFSRTTLSLAVAALASLGAPSAARAGEPPAPPRGLEGAALLDARAPILAAVRPTDLGDGFALADRVSGVFPEATRALLRVRDGLGFYALDGGELRESGIEPNALVLASLGLVEPGRVPLVRHRFVVKLLDDERFLRAALAVLAASQSSVARFDDDGAAPVPAWASARELAALARRAGVALLGRTRAGALVAVRYAGDFAIVDYGVPLRGPAATAKGETRRELASAFARLVAPPRQALAEVIGQGARPLLATSDAAVALVIEPGALAPLFGAGACGQDWSASDGAFFDDAALLLRLRPSQPRLDLVWRLTPLGRTRLAGAARDDRILDVRAPAGDELATAGLLLDEFDAVRDAPRPPILARGFDRAVDAASACGALGWLAAAARYWPQLAALEVEKLAGPADDKGAAASSFRTLRNVVAVVRRPTGGQRDWQQSTALVGSLVRGDELSVVRLASTVDPAHLRHDRATAPRRPVQLGQESPIGYLHLNLGHLVESWAAGADAGTRAAARAASAQLGQLGGDMILDGNFVRLELNLTARP